MCLSEVQFVPVGPVLLSEQPQSYNQLLSPSQIRHNIQNTQLPLSSITHTYTYCSFRRSLFPNFRHLNTHSCTHGLKSWNRILVFLRCFWTVWICDCSTCSCTGPQHRCYTTVQHRNIQSVQVAALPELRLRLLEILFERGNKNQKKTKSQTRFVWHTATPRQRLDTTCLFFKTSWPRWP